MGMPQISISNPNNDNMVYAHYCVFSFSADENGFFFYKDSVYKKIQRNITDGFTSRRQHGVWYDFSDMSYDGLCYDEIRVDWNYVEVPPELIAERRETQQARQAVLDEQLAREVQIVSQDYFIDDLVIIHTQDSGAECASGSEYKIEVRGDIGPDSSFALEELLRRSPNCLQENGNIKSRTIVELESLGGRLEDGYLMGRTFRSHEVETIITNNSACASSCAVAYLGGVERLMESDSIIMFHSPYLPDLNAQGDRIANCDIGSETTTELLEYYQEMTSSEQGERLMNRTMSYCSAEDGWVLRGSAAAELFGVATEI